MDNRRMSTFSSIIFPGRPPCPDCGRFNCVDENGLSGISCWAKKNPPIPMYDENGTRINKEPKLWRFDHLGNMTHGELLSLSETDISVKCQDA